VTVALQRGDIEEFCRARGFDLRGWCEDLGSDGKTLERPGLAAALAAVCGGGAEVVVAMDYSRVSPNLGVVAAFEDLVQAAGGRLEVVGGSMDELYAGERPTRERAPE
jgi:DNA invertase Pin-like site-specific DNA recombinase